VLKSFYGPPPPPKLRHPGLLSAYHLSRHSTLSPVFCNFSFSLYLTPPKASVAFPFFFEGSPQLRAVGTISPPCSIPPLILHGPFHLQKSLLPPLLPPRLMTNSPPPPPPVPTVFTTSLVPGPACGSCPKRGSFVIS